MRPLHKTYTPAAVDTDGIVDGATGADSPLTLLASGAGDGLAHQLNLTSGADISGIDFTITGTDADGVAITETIAGPAATTVETTNYFLTVTEITISATLGSDEVDIGWVDEFVTPTIGVNYHRSESSLRVAVTGTINYTAQQTFDELRLRSDGAFDWSDSTDTDLVSATASQISVFDKPVTGIRFKANSYSSGAALDVYFVQARY